MEISGGKNNTSKNVSNVKIFDPVLDKVNPIKQTKWDIRYTYLNVMYFKDFIWITELHQHMDKRQTKCKSVE